MTATLTVESTLTDSYQITLPESVRSTLHLRKRDKIRFSLQPDGKVILTRADDIEVDPVLEQFLSFLAKDVAEHPRHVHALSSSLVKRVQSLAGDVEINLESPLPDKD